MHDALGNLFTQLEALSANPGDPIQRQVMLSAANDVATRLNETAGNLTQMSGSLAAQAQTQTASINGLTSQIAQLNQQIHAATLAGSATNGLLDQRDQALASLSQLVNVRTIKQPYNEVSVFVNGSFLVLNEQAAKLSSTVTGQGQLLINSTGSTQPIDVSGGQLGGVLTLFNTTLPAVQNQLDTFAQSLASSFDKIQAGGIGLNGPMTNLASQRAVAHTGQILANAQLAFPPQAGDLYLTVTNLATGARTLHKVAIDPATQSLADVATALSAVPNVQAVVDSQTGTLHIVAQPGYGFDFSGNLSSSPDTQAITGTTVATVDGQYTGTANDTLSYTFSGAGTIGVTPNLMLQIHNGAGTLLGSVNVGQGYAAGSDLTTALGVRVKLATGTVNAGDSFTVNAVANPDTANLLPALGLNTFFVGSGAGGLQVNPNLLNDPGQLGLSASGQPGDGTNLTKLLALQTQPISANQSQSLAAVFGKHYRQRRRPGEHRADEQDRLRRAGATTEQSVTNGLGSRSQRGTDQAGAIPAVVPDVRSVYLDRDADVRRLDEDVLRLKKSRHQAPPVTQCLAGSACTRIAQGCERSPAAWVEKRGGASGAVRDQAEPGHENQSGPPASHDWPLPSGCGSEER